MDVVVPGLPGWAGARRNLLDFYGARENNRGTHTNHLAGCHSIRTIQWPTSITPHFCARCPSCYNPPTLSWLGTGTKYAGLHTQWHGCIPRVFWKMAIEMVHSVLLLRCSVLIFSSKTCCDRICHPTSSSGDLWWQRFAAAWQALLSRLQTLRSCVRESRWPWHAGTVYVTVVMPLWWTSATGCWLATASVAALTTCLPRWMTSATTWSTSTWAATYYIRRWMRDSLDYFNSMYATDVSSSSNLWTDDSELWLELITSGQSNLT